jgi:hypothetical protein
VQCDEVKYEKDGFYSNMGVTGILLVVRPHDHLFGFHH